MCTALSRWWSSRNFVGHGVFLLHKTDEGWFSSVHGFLISLQILHILSLYLAIASAVALAEVNISYPACRELTKYNFVVAFIWAIRFLPVYSQSLLTFELFSVMVHSGSAAGGHYYACIKSFSDGQWYSFNDQHVSKVSLDPRLNVTQNDSPDYVSACHHSLTWYCALNHCQCVSVHFCWADHPRWYQEDIWWILREQRLLLQCLCKVSCVWYLSLGWHASHSY